MIYPFPVANVANANVASQTAVTSAIGLVMNQDSYITPSAQSNFPTAPRAWAAIFGINGFSTGKYMAGASNGGLSNGWGIRTNGTSLSIWCAGTAGAIYNMSSNGWGNGSSGEIHGIVGTYNGHTGSGDLVTYIDRVLHDSVGKTGYTDPIPDDRFGIGSHPDGAFYGFNGVLYGLVVCDTVPNSSSVEQWFDDCKSAVDVVAFNTGSSSIWSVRQGAFDVPDNWNDESGRYIAAVRQSTIEAINIPGYTFSW